MVGVIFLGGMHNIFPFFAGKDVAGMSYDQMEGVWTISEKHMHLMYCTRATDGLLRC